MKDFKNKIKAEAEIVVTCEAEFEDVAKVLSFKETGADHSENIKRIQEEMEYNEWAWCTVIVEAYFRGLKGTAYLGQCSYKDEEEFKKDPYYSQMVDEAVEEINEQVNNLLEAVEE